MSQVSPRFLLEGSFYALEQCGLLLRSASILLDQGQFPSSIVLAAFAREELGRALILFDFLKQVAVSERTVSLNQIDQACENHVHKQKWAQVLHVTRGHGNDRVTQLIRIINQVNPDGPERVEFEKAWTELKGISDSLRKRVPEARSRTRMKALYVEPSESGSSWSRPREQFDEQESVLFLLDAINDYSTTLNTFQREIVDAKEGPIKPLIEAWTNRPEMPPLPWPKRKDDP